MKTGLTEIIVLLDRSGSMATIAKDTVGGFNSFVDGQKKEPGECRLSLTQFSSVGVEVVHENLPIGQVPPLTLHPMGGTPLLDAICETIDRAGERLAKTPEDERPEHVLFVIITDGEENQSQKFKLEDVRTRIKVQTEQWKWQFSYLGANVDAFDEAGKLGISADASSGYAPNAVCTANAYESLGSSVNRARSGQKLGYTIGERAANMGGTTPAATPPAPAAPSSAPTP